MRVLHSVLTAALASLLLLPMTGLAEDAPKADAGSVDAKPQATKPAVKATEVASVCERFHHSAAAGPCAASNDTSSTGRTTADSLQSSPATAATSTTACCVRDGVMRSHAVAATSTAVVASTSNTPAVQATASALAGNSPNATPAAVPRAGPSSAAPIVATSPLFTACPATFTTCSAVQSPPRIPRARQTASGSGRTKGHSAGTSRPSCAHCLST